MAKAHTTRVHSSLLIPSQVYNGTNNIRYPDMSMIERKHDGGNKNIKQQKITTYHAFTVRPKGHTIEQERALMEKHQRR